MVVSTDTHALVQRRDQVRRSVTEISRKECSANRLQACLCPRCWERTHSSYRCWYAAEGIALRRPRVSGS